MSQPDAIPIEERIDAARLRALRLAFRRLSHEIRGALNEILLKVEVARAELTAGHASEAALETLARAGAAASPLTARLDALARLVGPTSGEVRTFGAAEILEEIGDLLVPAALDRQVDVAVGWASVTMRTDRDACAALLLHVAVNALHATPPGGRLEMLPQREGDRVRIRFAGEPASPATDAGAWPFAPREDTPASAADLRVARHLAAELGGEVEFPAEAPGHSACTVRLPARPRDES